MARQAVEGYCSETESMLSLLTHCLKTIQEAEIITRAYNRSPSTHTHTSLTLYNNSVLIDSVLLESRYINVRIRDYYRYRPLGWC